MTSKKYNVCSQLSFIAQTYKVIITIPNIQHSNNKMKILNQQAKTNSHQTLNEPKPKPSTTCNHKRDMLLRFQNCHLPSIDCQQKCHHKQMKNQHSEDHQYSTQNELKKFMNNKIEHKNKAFMMEKEFLKKQIMRQIDSAQQIVKNIKDNLIKHIDALYYGAVKSGNDQTTAKGMDKFFNSHLDQLTCHEVYCLFSFKPLIDEKINSKISSGLKFLQRKASDMAKCVEKAKTSITQITQNILTAQEGQLSQMINQQEKESIKKNADNQKLQQKKDPNRMDQQIQQKNCIKDIKANIDILNEPFKGQKTQSRPIEKPSIIQGKQDKQPRAVHQQVRKEQKLVIREQNIARKEVELPKIVIRQENIPRKEVESSKLLIGDQNLTRKEVQLPIKHQSQIRKDQKQIIEQKTRQFTKETKQGIKETKQGIKDTQQGIKYTKQGIKYTKQVIKDLKQTRIEVRQDNLIPKPQQQHQRQQKSFHSQTPKPIHKQPEQPTSILKQTHRSQPSLLLSKEQKKYHTQQTPLKPQTIQKPNAQPIITQTMKQISRQTQKETIKQIRRQTPKETPKQAPKQSLKETPKQAPKQAFKQTPKPIIRQNTFKLSDYQKLNQKFSDKNAILQKCKKFQNPQQQTSKSNLDTLKSQTNTNESTKPINQTSKPINDPVKPLIEKDLSEKPKLITANQQFYDLIHNYKTLGSLDKMFPTDKSRKETPKVTQNQITTKKINEINPLFSQQFSHQKQAKTRIDDQSIKKNIFSDMKRAHDSYKQKYSLQGQSQVRKIVKTGNQFPQSTAKNDTFITKKRDDQKMIPEPETETLNRKSLSSKIKDMKDIFQSNLEIKYPTSNVTAESKKFETIEQKQKPIEIALGKKEQIKPQPIFTGSDKLFFELVRQSSQTQIQQPKQTKMDIEIPHQSSVQQKQTPTFKPSTVQQSLDKLDLDNKTVKFAPKQSQIPLLPHEESNKQQSNSNLALTETKKVDQRDQKDQKQQRELKDQRDQRDQSPRSFLAKPASFKVQEQPQQFICPQKIVPQQTPVQTFESGVKKIRLQHPGSRPFGRVSQNPIFNTLELFERGEQGLKQLQQRKQQKKWEYSRNSLLGQMQKANPNNSYVFEGSSPNISTPRQSLVPDEIKQAILNSKGQQSLRPISLEESNKNSQKKLNYNGNNYASKMPSWVSQRK